MLLHLIEVNKLGWMSGHGNRQRRVVIMKNFINLKDISAKDLRKILNDAKKKKE